MCDSAPFGAWNLVLLWSLDLGRLVLLFQRSWTTKNPKIETNRCLSSSKQNRTGMRPRPGVIITK